MWNITKSVIIILIVMYLLILQNDYDELNYLISQYPECYEVLK
jgi:uncharacterized integral membrane protein